MGLTKRDSAAAGLLIAMSVLAYLPAMGNGYVWDDDDYVTHTRHERSLHDLWDIWTDTTATRQYYPLVHTSFWVEYHMWGLHPAGYHVVNIILHGLTAMLFWLVLRRLNVPGAWVAAAIFAVHPITVESVAWVTERKNVLSGTCYAGALLMMLRFYNIDGDARAIQRADLAWRWYPWALLLFAGALLSKTVTATLPAVMVLLLWCKHMRWSWRTAVSLAPLFAMGIAMGLVTKRLEVEHIGAMGQDWDFTFIDRCLIASRAVWFYVGKVLWPIWPNTLVFIYPRWQIDAGAGGQYIFPAAALVVLVALLALQRSIGRGPIVAALIFVGTLAPALGFFNVYPMRFSFVADHFAYLASMALIALLVVAIVKVVHRLGPQAMNIAKVAAAVVLVALGATTWIRCGAYADAKTLWQDTLAKNDRCMIANINLASIHFDDGDHDKAHAYLRQAIDARPSHPLAYSSMAQMLLQTGQSDEAIKYLRRAIGLYKGFDIERGATHVKLGDLLRERGDLAAAAQNYRLAVRCAPRDIIAGEKLGQTYAQMGNYRGAIAAYNDLLRHDDTDALMHFNLGVAYHHLGRLLMARSSYSRAVQLDPDHVGTRNNLGIVLMTLDAPDQAIIHFEKALSLNPTDASTHTNLGVALAKLGQRDRAIAQLEQALAIKPDLAPALSQLARLLATNPNASADDRRQAVEYAQQACQLTDQKDPHALDRLAMAFAANSQFDQAIEAATTAATLAQSQGRTGLAGEIRGRISAYQKGERPWQ